MFALARTSQVPLVDQIVDNLAALIRREQLQAGARLPSIRKLAALVGASPYTVADAYDRLVARGLVESRAGRGFFVVRQPASASLVAVEATPASTSQALDLARLALASSGKLIPAGSGFLPASWLMDVAAGSVLARINGQRRPDAWLPCPAQGLLELREQLATMLLRRGIAAGPQNIATTYGASQAFDLIARVLFSPGDVVLVEDPGYFVLFEQLRAHHVRLVPIPRLAEGPDLAAIDTHCRTERPRAFFMQTLLHNPTGTSASPANAHRLLSLAEQYGFPIVEDDVYGDLHEGQGVRLAQMDGFRHVIHVGSFTKLIGPSVRVGFVAATASLIEQITERKMLSVLSGSALLESVVSEVLEGGRYRKHIEQTKARLARLRRDARRALAATGLVFDDQESEGMFLWARVPDGISVDRLALEARQASILLAKGALFSSSGGSRDHLRFNAVHSTAPELTQFLSRHLAITSQ